MKTVINRLFSIALIMVSVIACDDSESKKGDPSLKKSLEGKWVVSSSSGRIQSTGFESFEFNLSGNYIVVSEGDGVIFGIYNIIDDETIELEDYGTIKIISIDENSISFSFTPDGGDEISFTADKAPQVENSSKTKLLCRTWELITLNGTPVAGTSYELTVLFSDAGTYYVSTTGVATWQWKDDTEGVFCFSWEGDPTCTEQNQAIVSELSKSKLVVSDLFATYVLKPVTASGRKATGTNTFNGIVPKGGLFIK